MTVSEQIIQVLDDLCRRFGIVIDWTKETIAPYLEELMTKFITFEVKTSWFWIIFMSSITVLMWIIFTVLAIVNGTDSDVAIFLGVIACLATIVTIIVIGVQVYDIITCEVLPEKILLREVKELLQNAKNY